MADVNSLSLDGTPGSLLPVEFPTLTRCLGRLRSSVPRAPSRTIVRRQLSHLLGRSEPVCIRAFVDSLPSAYRHSILEYVLELSTPGYGYDWGLSHAERNALQHALNGNRNRGKTKSVKVTRRVVQTVVKKKRGRRIASFPRSSLPKMSRMDAVCRAYAGCLADPFEKIPPTLGFGRYDNNVQICSAMRRGTASPSTTEFVVGLNPNAILSNNTGAISTALLNCFSFTAIPSGPGYPWAAAGVSSASTAANYGVLLNIGSVYRILSAGIRVLVASPATSTPPLVLAARLPGVPNYTALDNMSNTTFASVPHVRSFTSVGGVTCVEQVWFPTDFADMSFSDINTYIAQNGNGVIQPLVVSCSGLPAGSRVSWEMIVNVELEMGALAGSSELASGARSGAAGPCIAQVIPSADQLMAGAATHINTEPVFSVNESYTASAGNIENSSFDFWGTAARLMTGAADLAELGTRAARALRPRGGRQFELLL